MKKFGKVLMAALLSLTMCFTGAACSREPVGPDAGGGELPDEHKIQLYVFNFNGGYGGEWLTPLKRRFEEKFADYENESAPGRKGVQIMITNQKTGTGASDSILNNKEEVLFNESVYYYTSKEYFADITDAVTGDLSVYGDAEGSTILSKMTAEQKDYFAVQESDGAHYYGLPHYSGFVGITYDKDLFESRNLYISGTDAAGRVQFVSKTRPNKSVGIDNVAGTEDDGLPTTYDEFYQLCDQCYRMGINPIMWSGHQYSDYLNRFFSALVADAAGLAEMSALYAPEGKQVTSLGTVSASGEWVPDGAPVSTSDYAELARMKGRYDALTFLRRLVTTDNWHHGNAFNGNHSYTDAQDNFLMFGNVGGNASNLPNAMLIEGVWWESEATDTFNEMALNVNQKFAKKNRNFGFMPLPKPDAASLEAYRALGKSGTLMDTIYSMCFVKKNIEAWKLPLAVEFIKFANTDQSLKEYTEVTDTVRSLNYTFTEEELAAADMSEFGKSIVRLKQSSDILYPVSSSPIYNNNASSFSTQYMWTANVGGMEYTSVPQAFHDRGVTVKQYFDGMVAYARAKNWN